MRIYAVADIHGKIDNIAIIKDVISQKKPDLLVIAGDITQYFFSLKTLDMLKNISIPILCVRGNSDLKRVEGLLKNQENTTLLNHAPVTYQGKKFLGLNGTIPLPFVSKISFQEAKNLGQFKKTITSETILVVHPPPRGVCDKVGNKFHAGSFGLRNFIKTHPPLMVLCGHIHEQAGYKFLNNTLVVNCAMNKIFCGAIIDGCKKADLRIKMVERNT
jgi:uncharacterized protein